MVGTTINFTGSRNIPGGSELFYPYISTYLWSPFWKDMFVPSRGISYGSKRVCPITLFSMPAGRSEIWIRGITLVTLVASLVSQTHLRCATIIHNGKEHGNVKGVWMCLNPDSAMRSILSPRCSGQCSLTLSWCLETWVVIDCLRVKQ
jgi:hypothetical protein